jgi:hypothetical protein
MKLSVWKSSAAGNGKKNWKWPGSSLPAMVIPVRNLSGAVRKKWAAMRHVPAAPAKNIKNAVAGYPEFL